MMKMDNRLHKFRLTKKLDSFRETKNILPKQIIYMSVEGSKTETSYFNHLKTCLQEQQEAPLITIEVLSHNDNCSDPRHVLGLLQEHIALNEEGVIPSIIKKKLQAQDISEEDIKAYVNDNSILTTEKKDIINEFCELYNLDVSYRKYLKKLGKNENDRYVVIIDRDSKSHMVEAIEECIKATQNKNVPIELYISNPAFDIWLLFHSAQGCEFLRTKGEVLIKENKKKSEKNTLLSYQVSQIFHHSKEITSNQFRQKYWNKISYAIDASQNYKLDNHQLLDQVGTNIADFFTKDIKKLLPKTNDEV